MRSSLPRLRVMLSSFLALAFGAGLVVAPRAWAGETDPTLALYSGRRTDGADGTTLRVEGRFPWNALLQSGYPLELVLWPTDGLGEFLRVGVDGVVRSGEAPFVLDGLTPGEAAALSSIGQLDASHGLTYVAEGRLDLRVTGAFAGRPLEAQLIVIDTGTPFVSNVVVMEGD